MTTTTEIPAVPDQAPAGDPNQEDSPAASVGRWRRWHTITVVVGALALLGGGAVAWSASVDAGLADSRTAAVDALNGLADSRTTALEAWENAAATLDLPEGATSEDADALLGDTTASDLFELAPTHLALPKSEGPWLERTTRRDALTVFAADANELAGSIRAASTSLDESVQAWQLAGALTELGQARTDLDDALAAAGSTLSGSKGRVLDDSSRVALSEAITTAQGVRAAAVDGQDIDSVTQAVADLTAQTAAVNGAVPAVNEAVEAWQVEQDRIAAEQAAAAARVQTTPSNPGGGKKTTPKDTTGIGQTGTGGSNPTGGSTGGQSDGSTWVESGSDTWCFQGDTSGAEGTGGWC